MNTEPHSIARSHVVYYSIVLLGPLTVAIVTPGESAWWVIKLIAGVLTFVIIGGFFFHPKYPREFVGDAHGGFLLLIIVYAFALIYRDSGLGVLLWLISAIILFSLYPGVLKRVNEKQQMRISPTQEDWTVVKEFGNNKIYVSRTSVVRNGAFIRASVKYALDPPGIDKLNGKPIKEMLLLEEYDVDASRFRVHQITFTYIDDKIGAPLSVEQEWSPATAGNLDTLQFLVNLQRTELPDTWTGWIAGLMDTILDTEGPQALARTMFGFPRTGGCASLCGLDIGEQNKFYPKDCAVECHVSECPESREIIAEMIRFGCARSSEHLTRIFIDQLARAVSRRMRQKIGLKYNIT